MSHDVELGSVTLSEAASKALVTSYGVPVARELVVGDAAGAREAFESLAATTVVVKLNGDRIAHKTERGLVALGVRSAAEAEAAAARLLGLARPDDGDVSVLVAEQVAGNRELIAGVQRDPHFGPCVMVGIGGVLAEAVADVAIRLVPITTVDAEEMIEQLSTQRLLGAFRGEPPVDRAALAQVLLALSALAAGEPSVRSVDLNPLIVCEGRPIAVDALVEVDAEAAA